MNSDITTDNIARIAKAAGLDLSPDEQTAVRGHLQHQAERFAALNGVETAGVSPCFGVDGDVFIVERKDK